MLNLSSRLNEYQRYLKGCAKTLLRSLFFRRSTFILEHPNLYSNVDSCFSLVASAAAEVDLATHLQYKSASAPDFLNSDPSSDFTESNPTQNPRYLLRISFPLIIGDYSIATSRSVMLQEPGYPSFPYVCSALIPRRPWHFLLPRKRGNYLLLPLPWWDNYYHWIAQILPKLHGFLDYLPRDCFFIVPQSIKEWQLHSLLCLGVRPDKIIRKKSCSTWSVENLFWLSPVAGSAKHTAVSLKWLKKCVFKSLSINGSSHSSKIYITRSSTKRSIANESEFLPDLINLGFQVVDCAKLSFFEQVYLFSHCNYICGPHGAGLANMIWCAEDTTVLEIAPSNITDRKCFGNMALNLGHRYELFEVQSCDTSLPDDDYNADPESFLDFAKGCIQNYTNKPSKGLAL